MSEIEVRGYDDSDKSICSGCVGDKYFYKLIRTQGAKGYCSFCGKSTRNVFPMNAILASISTIIDRNYLPADGNAMYDHEEKRYLEPIIDPYDFVHDELNQYLESDNDEFLQELVDKLTFEDRISIGTFTKRQEEKDLEQWNAYCNLVKATPLSAEQIVSLIKSESHKDELPEDIEAIQGTLEMVYGYCEDLGLVKNIASFNTKKEAGVTPIYRCVNFLDWNPNYAGLSFIPAMLVGTAPAKVVQDSRMSEKGDMMFYGADDKDTALIEVGKNNDHPNYPATMGTFYSNKQFRILDLSTIDDEKLPSIFDTSEEYKRSAWFFLNEFVDQISLHKSDDKDFYKPTQVFTKYIQRNTDLKGLKYKSSKAPGNCYTLFVVNRDCLDKDDKINENRNQLIMEKVEQMGFQK